MRVICGLSSGEKVSHSVDIDLELWVRADVIFRKGEVGLVQYTWTRIQDKKSFCQGVWVGPEWQWWVSASSRGVASSLQPSWRYSSQRQWIHFTPSICNDSVADCDWLPFQLSGDRRVLAIHPRDDERRRIRNGQTEDRITIIVFSLAYPLFLSCSLPGNEAPSF